MCRSFKMLISAFLIILFLSFVILTEAGANHCKSEKGHSKGSWSKGMSKGQSRGHGFDKLNLTDEQKEQMKKIREKIYSPEKMQGFKKSREDMKKLRDQFNAEFIKILTPDQKKKYEAMQKEGEKQTKDHSKGKKCERGKKDGGEKSCTK